MSFAGPVPEAFEREHGCTPTDWRRWLGEAFGASVRIDGDVARVRAGAGDDGTAVAGHLVMHWTVLEPRRIALLALPRMAIRYRFEALDEPARRALLSRLDLHTRRGGG